MTCRAKHTPYQPEMPDEWKCPECGASSEEGFVLEDPAEGADDACSLNHVADGIICNRCEWGGSGATFARRLQKKRNLVPCEHCKGKGLVPGVKT